MNSKKNRASLMVVVAAYLIYTVWQLFQGRNDPETTMSPALIYLFCALFAVAGVGLVIYAVRLWREGRLAEGALIVMEHSADHQIDGLDRSLEITDRRAYRDTALTLARYSSKGGAAG